MNFETINAKKVEEYARNNNGIIIDVRNPDNYIKGHIPKAINIPYNMFEEVKSKLPKDKILILYCERGSLSLILCRDLCKEGFNVKNVYGGISSYRGEIEL